MHVNQGAVVFVCGWIIKGGEWVRADDKQQSHRRLQQSQCRSGDRQSPRNWQAAVTGGLIGTQERRAASE